jgi:hypothetical protein
LNVVSGFVGEPRIRIIRKRSAEIGSQRPFPARKRGVIPLCGIIQSDVTLTLVCDALHSKSAIEVIGTETPIFGRSHLRGSGGLHTTIRTSPNLSGFDTL